MRLGRTLPRLQSLVADCGARVALTTSGIADLVEPLTEGAPDLRALRWLATDTVAPTEAEAWRAPALSGESMAFLQYTSGSTGTPRGVVLRHRHLLHNSWLIARGFDASPNAVGVLWLPPYHDMGLIGGLLQPLYRDFPMVLLPPLSFLQRPMGWLEAVSRYGGSVCGAPNFAFDLCVRKSTPAQRAALDLSRWEAAFCGAEPVRADTLDRFAEAFAPRASGVRRSTPAMAWRRGRSSCRAACARRPRWCGASHGRACCVVKRERPSPRPRRPCWWAVARCWVTRTSGWWTR